jgi:hypothetical protein
LAVGCNTQEVGTGTVKHEQEQGTSLPFFQEWEAKKLATKTLFQEKPRKKNLDALGV